MKRKPSPKAFTLAELLTLFVVIGFFAAVLAPVAEQNRRSATRTADRDKIRRIAEAALIYGSDNEGNLPQNNLDGIGKPTAAPSAITANAMRYAAALAQGAGLNDGAVWKSVTDRIRSAPRYHDYRGGAILNADKSAIAPDFHEIETLAFGVITGLTTSDPSTTPIAFTRGLQASGVWHSVAAVYGSEGGHVAHLGGNVAWYRDTAGPDGDGVFVRQSDGERSKNIVHSVGMGNFFWAGNSLAGPLNGMSGW